MRRKRFSGAVQSPRGHRRSQSTADILSLEMLPKISYPLQMVKQKVRFPRHAGI